MKIELTSPSPQFRQSFLNAQAELSLPSEISAWVYLGDSADPAIPLRDFDAYVNTLERRKTDPPPGFVCDTTYWAVHSGEVVGRISIRHELNEFLAKVGGHIGYITRPSARGKGVASQMLEALLRTERARSIGKLLLTCDAGNIASRKTIEKNGGKLAGTFPAGPDRADKCHFWIDLSGEKS